MFVLVHIICTTFLAEVSANHVFPSQLVQLAEHKDLLVDSEIFSTADFGK